MSGLKAPSVDMAGVRSGDAAALAVALAGCAARWFAMADSHIAFCLHPSHVALMGDKTKAGLLAAALELRELLAQSPQGRQALRDFGFEPVAQNVEGE